MRATKQGRSLNHKPLHVLQAISDGVFANIVVLENLHDYLDSMRLTLAPHSTTWLDGCNGRPHEAFGHQIRRS